MKKFIVIICLMMGQMILIHAQQVKGGVFEMVGDESSPLVGANVVQLNALNGITSDVEGHFNLKLERKAQSSSHKNWLRC